MKGRLRLIIALILFTTVLAVAALVYMRSQSKPAPAQGIPTQGGESLSIKIDVPYFAQADPEWKNDTLGESGDSLASYGCTVCSAAMALHAFDKPCTPKTLNTYLSDNGGFTANGLLIWSALRKYAGEDSYNMVIKNSTTHDYLDQQLKLGIPVIAKVLWQRRIWHWVLITGKEGNHYLIADPLVPDNPHIKANDYPEGFFSIRHLKKI